MKHFDGCPTVGYCWDSGHEMCYNHSEDFLGKYGQRMIMMHLNDNLGISRFDGMIQGRDDLHLLPFDGKIPWEQAIGRLKDLPKQSILNFELKKRAANVPGVLDYEELSVEEYFSLAGQRARQIADLYDNIMDAKKA